MKEFKIRCSAIGQIISKPREKNRLLSKTAESYCDLWIKEQLYNRKYEFSNKYTDKGIIVEDYSIDFIAKTQGYGFLLKNEELFENEYMTGTPDILPPNEDVVIDAKSSWGWETFPLLETDIPNKDYYWQLQGYMALTGRKHARLAYVLTDTPVHLIEREARQWCYNNGYEELDMEIYETFLRKMTYADIPDGIKIKMYDIERSEEAIANIVEAVKKCREYIIDRLNNSEIKWK